MIVFLKMEEGHLQHLHVVFNCFREHNLRLKPTKCKFFQNEMNYLAHHISKEGVWPSKENLKAVAEFTPPWTYMEIQAFLGLVGHYQQFIKGFACVVQPLHKHLSGEGATKKNEQVTLIEEALDAFENLKKACLEASMLAFADFNKAFLLETDTSKFGLGAVLSEKQTDSWYHSVAYASWSLTIQEHNYHSTKQEFLALKWVIVEQFQEYLLWKLFIFRTGYNPLIYIMTTSNLDASSHCWVESLVTFSFSIEYQKGWDNAAVDALGQVTLKLDAETMKSILNGVTIGMTERADAHDLVVAEADEEINKQVQEIVALARTAQVHVNLHVTDWVTNQKEDPIHKDLKHLLGDDTNTNEGKTILQEWKKLMLYQGALYHCHTSLLEEVLWSPQLIKLLSWMDVTKMLDTRVISELCTYYMTGSGALEWPCTCRRPLVAANSASNTKILMIKCQCTLSLSLLPWSCYTWTSQALGPL